MIEIAKEIVLQAGERLRTNTHHTITEKSSICDLVSDMDVMIEHTIIEQLKNYYPTHTFLCEEGDKQLSSHTWILDPIDGTTNFISKHRDFAISLAYYEDHKPVFGLVYDVMRDELFCGITNEGAWCNQMPLACLTPVEMHESILDISLNSLWRLRQHQVDLMPIQREIRGHRSLNCASLAICHIAQGISNAYISCSVHCWDYAAACIILQEVEGTYRIMQDFFTIKKTLAVFAGSQSLLQTIYHEYLDGYVADSTIF